MGIQKSKKKESNKRGGFWWLINQKKKSKTGTKKKKLNHPPGNKKVEYLWLIIGVSSYYSNEHQLYRNIKDIDRSIVTGDGNPNLSWFQNSSKSLVQVKVIFEKDVSTKVTIIKALPEFRHDLIGKNINKHTNSSGPEMIIKRTKYDYIIDHKINALRPK